MRRLNYVDFVLKHVIINNGCTDNCGLVMGVPCHRHLAAELGSSRLSLNDGWVMTKQPDKPKVISAIATSMLLLYAHFIILK